MKDIIVYLKEKINTNVPEFKEYDMNGQRIARSLTLNSENIVSVSQKIDLALDSIKTGYFLRILNSKQIGMCFYNTPTDDEINLIVKSLKEFKYTKYYTIKVVNVEEINKNELILIENF